MIEKKYSILQFMSFGELNKWNVDPVRSNMFHNVRYPTYQLKNILKRRKDLVKVEDDKLYKRITIRQYGLGVYLRDEVYGRDIGTKRQFIAKKGQFIISRIDARNGSFGVVPEELDGAIVTNDFWLFDVYEANIKYLMLLLSSSTFQEYWQKKSNGTTNRQRVDETDFLNSKIPLPTLVEQDRLVGNYYNTIQVAENNEKEALRTEENVDRIFSEELGIIDILADKEDPKYRFISFSKLSELSRWDLWNKKEELFSSKFKFTTFETIIKGAPMYGANEKATKKNSDVRYIRITDINEDGSLNENFVSAKNVDSKYLLKDNDFLIARSGNTVGKTLLYKEEMGKSIFAGYLIKYVLNVEKVIPEYVFYYTKSKLFKRWIISNQRIFGQPNINGQEYLKFPILIPPISSKNSNEVTQEKIVGKVSEMKEQIKKLRRNAVDLRQLANKQFEDGIFFEN
ncbi:restriction endonuclease subunit S [Paenibacillus sp. P46E]|uniref:restriction endonuclease subunit S n=1 Tax=Paenibacillus sp. P46E TaxID=1349436 RepID=UPI00093DD98F|nr:restriction endonuclease subunit S [Paenibacillus sp. P46E]OKP97053.1 hypothetical protein A3849_18075 [Paenibacillus sp. P46E]